MKFDEIGNDGIEKGNCAVPNKSVYENEHLIKKKDSNIEPKPKLLTGSKTKDASPKLEISSP